jgi:pimeloyl-ACP methyl ester carboxylesterase
MSQVSQQDVIIPAGEDSLYGMLALPTGARGVVVFAHGSGSSRFSPRNQETAAVLQRSGIGTLLFDLLTEQEAAIDEETREHRFDIPLLGRRLVAATDWLRQLAATGALDIGYFGASTGAAAALVAAAERSAEVSAVVSRGGRPDLAGDALNRVTAPTLMIVGGLDRVVIGMNEWARERLSGVTELVIVPGATHLFEEPGTMDEVTHHAAAWFQRYLAGSEG